MAKDEWCIPDAKNIIHYKWDLDELAEREDNDLKL